MPCSRCSISIHAPPMPRIARPSLAWSIVVIDLATMPGLRNVFAPTSSPSRVCSVSRAHAAQQRVALEEVLVGIAEDRVQVVPRPEVGVAEAVDPLRGVEHLGPGRGLAPEQDFELDIGHVGQGLRAVGRRSSLPIGRRGHGNVAMSCSRTCRSSASLIFASSATARAFHSSRATLSPATALARAIAS